MRTFGRRAERTSAENVGEVEEEPAISAERLQRHTSRFKAADPTAGDEQAVAPATALPDTLLGNAFAILGVALDASAATIDQAYDDLSFAEGSDPRALDEARARLMSARERLTQELYWLPESSTEIQAEARVAIRAADTVALARLRDRTTGLARINLAVALAQGRQDEVDEMIGVFLDVKRWQSDATHDALDEARGRGGFRPIDPDQWDLAVRTRLDEVAALVAAAFARSADGRTKLVRLMQQERADSSGAQAKFLDAVMNHYVAGIDETLGRLGGRIAECADKLRERPTDRAQATSLLSSLDIWSSYRLPIQVMEAARALDDPASATIFSTVRDLSIHLTNDHKQYDTALLLARALLHSFAHVPNSRQAMERELPTLIQNAALGRVEQVCERAFLQDATFARDVLQGGMGQGACGVAGQLVAVFEQALEQWQGDASLLFLIARHTAVRLHNELGHHEITPIIMHWLLSMNPPAEVDAKIREDLENVGPVRRGWR